MWLNEGEPEHIGLFNQEFKTPFNLEDERLTDIKEIELIVGGAATNSMTTGTDVTIPVSFE
jgi:hypothetical protein